MQETADVGLGTTEIDFLSGGGEMGARIRAFEWSKTSLGPVERWPQSLRSAVSILLPSKAQIVLFWGRDLITLYNDAYRPVFGAKHPSALGLPAYESWKELWITGLKELIEGVLCTGEAFWASDRPFFMERYGYLEETFFDVSYDPVRDETGHVGGVFCIVNETTARVVAERRLRTLQELSTTTTEEVKSVEQVCQAALRILANNRRDLPFSLIYLLDAEGKNARLMGSMGLPEKSPAAPLSVDMTASMSEPMAWPFRAVLAAGRAEVMTGLDQRVGPLQGSVWPESPNTAVVLPISVSGQKSLAGFLVTGVSPRRPLDDQYRGFFDLLTNQIATSIANVMAFEEARKRADALAELDRAKTAFFSNVSHEFRTPLTLMLGPLEDALANVHGILPMGVARDLSAAHRNSLRLLKLVNTLLDFSRIEAGRAQTVYEEMDLAALTADLASVFRSTIEKAGLSLIVDCPPLPEHVFVDRDMWEKIVLNLLSNAFKFTFHGEIEVALRPSGKHVELSIRDTGTGIPEDQLGKIFERFHRIPGAEGRTHEGTGIGLALVQELARLHGGFVSVDSKYGTGSTFHVSIPFGKEHLPHKQIDAGRSPAPTALGVAPFVEEALRWLPEEHSDELRVLNAERESQDTLSVKLLGTRHAAHSKTRPLVLVADDNADMRQYIARLLAERYAVKVTSDGEAALAVVREWRPDLVLSDVMMPRLDGFGLLSALRGDPATKTIPVILLSARAGEESRIEGLKEGADDYLIKPFSARELLAKVASHLDISRVRKETHSELEQRNGELTRLRLAALNLMEDAVEARRHAEQVSVSLRESEERLQLAQQVALIGTFELNIQTGVNVWTPELEMMHGLAPGSFARTQPAWENLLHPDDRQEATGLVQQSCETGLPTEGEWRVVWPDGSLHWLAGRWQVFKDATGKPSRVSGANIDITERKKSEMLLAEQKELLEFIATGRPLKECLAALADSVDRLQPAARASVLMANVERTATAESFTAYLPQSFLAGMQGTPISELAVGTCNTAIFTGESVTCTDIARNTYWSHHWRELCLAHGIKACYSTPVLSPNGTAIASFFLCFSEARQPDEWERRLAEFGSRVASIAIERDRAVEALRDNEERLRTAMTAGDMGAWDFDLGTGTITWDAKQFELFGRPPHDPPSNTDEFYSLVHADDIERVKLATAAAVETGRFLEEFRIVRPDGTVRWMVGQGGTVTDQQGQRVRLVGVNYDITKRKMAQARIEHFAEEMEREVAERTEELVRSQGRLRALATELNLAEQRERKRLAGDLHDYLAQLLVLCRLNLGQIRRAGLPSIVEQKVQETDEVLDQALTYSRTLMTELSPPALREHGLPSGLKWLAQQMKSRGLMVTVEIGDVSDLSLPEDCAVLLFQSVRELLMNVLKHADSQDVTVRIGRTEEMLRIEVCDDGIGFEVVAAAAAVAASTPTAMSSKFGLFSINERMTAMEGWFDLQSAPGEGTTATLVLPLRSSAECSVLSPELSGSNSALPSRSALSTQDSALQQDAKIRVLLVDDHAMVRQGLRTVLDSYADIEVVGEAWNGEEAVAGTERLRPAVVVMDIHMPKRNGIEATRLIKKRHPDIVVIGLSVQVGGDNERAMKQAGGALLLTKEAAVDELYQAIQEALKTKV